MQILWVQLTACILVSFMVIAGCTSPQVSPALPVSPSAGIQVTTEETVIPERGPGLHIGTLSDGGVLPDIYTCRGSGESPPVSWDRIPAGTKSLVLILDDPDAPGGTFTHWIVYNIPSREGSLAPSQPNAKVLANSAQQGETSAGSRGYYPPCPPPGTTHRYIFRLYAVDMDITQPIANRDSIDWALMDHTLAKTMITTSFKR